MSSYSHVCVSPCPHVRVSVSRCRTCRGSAGSRVSCARRSCRRCPGRGRPCGALGGDGGPTRPAFPRPRPHLPGASWMLSMPMALERREPSGPGRRRAGLFPGTSSACGRAGGAQRGAAGWGLPAPHLTPPRTPPRTSSTEPRPMALPRRPRRLPGTNSDCGGTSQGRGRGQGAGLGRGTNGGTGLRAEGRGQAGGVRGRAKIGAGLGGRGTPERRANGRAGRAGGRGLKKGAAVRWYGHGRGRQRGGAGP